MNGGVGEYTLVPNGHFEFEERVRDIEDKLLLPLGVLGRHKYLRRCTTLTHLHETVGISHSCRGKKMRRRKEGGRKEEGRRKEGGRKEEGRREEGQGSEI
jgi:hypothetical protein